MSALTTSPLLRILIIEDDPIMRLGLKQLLDHQPNKSVVGMAEDGDRVQAAVTALRNGLVQ